MIPVSEYFPAEIWTTDRADEHYLLTQGIRPVRTEQDADGVMVSVYANDKRLRQAVNKYWRDYETGLREKYKQSIK